MMMIFFIVVFCWQLGVYNCRAFVAQMASHFASSNHGSLLYLIKVSHYLQPHMIKVIFTAARDHTEYHYCIDCCCCFVDQKTACNFMLSSFNTEAEQIRELFLALLFKGKRDVR